MLCVVSRTCFAVLQPDIENKAGSGDGMRRLEC